MTAPDGTDTQIRAEVPATEKVVGTVGHGSGTSGP
jgi:hypothetical protein